MKKIIFVIIALASIFPHLASPVSPYAVKGFDRLIQPKILETLYPLFFPNTAHDLGRNLKLYGNKKSAWTTLANGLFKQVNDNGSLQLIELGKGSVCTKMNLFYLGGLYALVVGYNPNSIVLLKKAITILCTKTNLQKNAIWSLLHKIDDAKKLAWSEDSKKGPAALIALYAGLRAETKADLLLFLRGFIAYYIFLDKIDTVLTPKGKDLLSSNNKSAQILFLQEKYIPKDRTDILNQTYPNPTTFDYLWFCSSTTSSEPIRVLSIATPNLNQMSVGDCVEHGLCSLIFTLLEDVYPGELTAENLPQSLRSSSSVLKFISWFNKTSINEQKARTDFFYLFSDKENKAGKADLEYHNASPSKHYELEASDSNILKALRFFFGINAKNFKELGEQLSIPEKRTITFNVKQCEKKTSSALEPNQQIIMTIKDENGYQTCTLNIVTNTHVGVSGEDSQNHSQKEDREKQKILLNKASIKIEQFPFCSTFPTQRADSIDIFRRLEDLEFNNLCRVSVKTPQVYASFKNIFNEQAIKPCIIDLDDDIPKLLIEHGDKEPFRTFIKTVNVEELERILKQNDLASDFARKINLFKDDLIHRVSASFLKACLGNLSRFYTFTSQHPIYKTIVQDRGFALSKILIKQSHKKEGMELFLKQRPTFAKINYAQRKDIIGAYETVKKYFPSKVSELVDQDPLTSCAQIPQVLEAVICDALAENHKISRKLKSLENSGFYSLLYDKAILPVLITYLNTHVPETLWSNQKYIDKLAKALKKLNVIDESTVKKTISKTDLVKPLSFITEHCTEEPYATFLKNSKILIKK
ncbi:TPA: hypothetical protein DDZ86_00325 [Candidatus Dependentiae bacterium]|nr:MAG: hypothetical protein UW09_C0002G0057 [candidate division TM6 bacterium GW2011_GWF2_43_87]HBL98074.1 hypothetical protein [Candidatus Dependentiae bacterium]